MQPYVQRSPKSLMAAASLAVDSFALAGLLADAVSSRGDVDGILLGSVRDFQRSARVTDATDRPTEVRECVSLLRGHVCATSALSFYDAAGCVDEDALARLLAAADAPMLGWFVARRASPLTPSVRETEVWARLQQRASRLGLSPPLFGLIGSDQPADGQPFSTQFVFWAPQPDAPQQLPTALPVTVLNVGGAPGHRGPEPSALPSSWHPLLDGAAGTDAAAPWRALEAAAVHGAEQTRVAFESALERATALCLEVERADDALHASRERARLKAAELEEELARETLSDDDATLATAAVELRDTDAPQTAYEPPPVLLSDVTAAPVGAPSILDEILADERQPAAGTQQAALQY